MKEPTDIGLNRTGMSASPWLSGRMTDDTWMAMPAVPGNETDLGRIRIEYARVAGPLGSVPPPANLKGVATTFLQMGQGRKPTAFLDKLAERMAFERTGTRLYEILIGKFQASDSPTGPVTLDGLKTFHDQELAHFGMLCDCLEKLGADPTVETPCADLVGVECLGLVQAMADPRTTFAQTLHGMLIAELADNDGWRMLIDLAEGMKQHEMAETFRQAWKEEDVHLDYARSWMASLEKEEAHVPNR